MEKGEPRLASFLVDAIMDIGKIMYFGKKINHVPDKGNIEIMLGTIEKKRVLIVFPVFSTQHVKILSFFTHSYGSMTNIFRNIRY
jgi:hypothetical protein